MPNPALHAPPAVAATPPVREGRPADLVQRYNTVRQCTEWLAEPLSPEDATAQSMPDASPAKWHLAHTTWFFETFLLQPRLPGYTLFDSGYAYLFNSYYNSVGAQYPRPQRGLITRPGLVEVRAYRAHVDQAMERLLTPAADAGDAELAALLEVGLNHEQQHQELLVTDLKHLLSFHPSGPVYRARPAGRPNGAGGAAAWSLATMDWERFEGGLVEIGTGGAGFAFDNERPRHRVWLNGFQLARRPVLNGDFLAFIEAGGYRDPLLWLAEGWDVRQREQWAGPLYWERLDDGRWCQRSLSGWVPLDPLEPVCHVSYYEADAFARWAGARLPTEQEWEHGAARALEAGAAGADAHTFLEDGRLHPAPLAPNPARLCALFGEVWEWTASSYQAYPGYQPAAGALGEYNGKFMCSQQVLRGGSCATPRDHIRIGYRNFFPPSARWQFSGLRLARDAR